MKRYFMTIPEASQLVMQAGAIGQGGEIFILDMGKPIKILNLAREMIRRCGLRPGEDIAIEFSGIRPGEKLYEELAGENEKTCPTAHAKIRIWRLPAATAAEVAEMLSSLSEASRGSRQQVISALKRAVPEFNPDGWVAARREPALQAAA